MSVGVFPGLLTTVDENCVSGMFRYSRGDWSAPGPQSFTQGSDKHPWPLSLQMTFQRNRRKPSVPTSAASHESEALPCEGGGRRLFPYSERPPSWSRGVPELSWSMCIQESPATFLQGWKPGAAQIKTRLQNASKFYTS